MDADLSLSTAIVLDPRRAGLCAGQDNLVEVLVRVQAPPPPAPDPSRAERPPLALAVVIDRSGSMQGRPIAEAVRCAERIVDALRPTDTLSLVQFSNSVQRLWPAVPVGDGRGHRGALVGLQADGGTNLHGGWLEGADTLVDVPGTGLKRVMLLSDGQANDGCLEPHDIATQCAAWAARGITTSTYGLGDGFNESLMMAMARAGGGNAYYGDTADDLMDPFREELALLDHLALRRLRLRATVDDGLQVEVANDLPLADGAWCLPDLAWGAEAWAVLRVKLPADRLPPTGRQALVLRVQVEGCDLDGRPVRLERSGLSLPVLAPLAFEALPSDERVSRRLIELAAAQALLKVREAADRFDWPTVDRLLDDARRQFAGHDWVASVLQAMQALGAQRSRERMLKESVYSVGKMHQRLTVADEATTVSDLAGEAAVPAYLRRKAAQGKGQAPDA